MGKISLVCVLLLAALALGHARIPRNEAERLQDEERLRRQQESGVHTYYLLVKPPADAKNSKERTELLAGDFHKRLGGDEHVTVVAASKVMSLSSTSPAPRQRSPSPPYLSSRCRISWWSRSRATMPLQIRS